VTDSQPFLKAEQPFKVPAGGRAHHTTDLELVNHQDKIDKAYSYEYLKDAKAHLDVRFNWL